MAWLRIHTFILLLFNAQPGMPCRSLYISKTGSGYQCEAENLNEYSAVTLSTCNRKCLQTDNCWAFNYAGNNCSLLSSACIVVQAAPNSVYKVLRRQANTACISWGTYPSTSRYVLNDGEALVLIRTTHEGAIIFGHLLISNTMGYFAWSGGAHIVGDGFDTMFVHEGCSVAWVPYVAREEIPARAVEEGWLADGTRVYIARMYSDVYSQYAYGYYPEGSEVGFYETGGNQMTASDMDVLVSRGTLRPESWAREMVT